MHGSHWTRRTVLGTGSAGALGLAIGACGRGPASAATAANVISTSSDPIPSDAIALTPDDPRLTFSSFASISERSPERFRASRFEDGQGLGAVSPCGRLSFHTTSSYVAFDVAFPDKVDGHRIVDGEGAWDPFYADILIDGRLVGAIVGRHSMTELDVQTGSLTDLPPGEKLIELIWPYERAMILTSVRLSRTADVKPAYLQESRLVCGGDSITQGFAADRPSGSYPFLLASMLGLQLVNMGFSSRIAISSDGTRDGKVGAKVGTYMIGVNDFLLHKEQNRSPLQFFSSLKSYIENWFIANPVYNTKLYVISPLYISQSKLANLSLQTYRNLVNTACYTYAVSNPNHGLYHVDGESLLSASDKLLYDGLHPTSQGHAQVAECLVRIMRQT